MARRRPLDRDRAWTYLLYLLSRRDYTVAELATKLRRRELPDDIAEALLARLQELRLADDERYAEHYVASRSRARGRMALRGELRRKGVDPTVVDRELQPLSDRQQVEAAAGLLTRSAWRYRPGSLADRAGRRLDSGAAAEPNDADERRTAMKERARAFAFLARRGFTAEAANAAIAALGWWQDEP